MAYILVPNSNSSFSSNGLGCFGASPVKLELFIPQETVEEMDIQNVEDFVKECRVGSYCCYRYKNQRIIVEVSFFEDSTKKIKEITRRFQEQIEEKLGILPSISFSA